MTLNFSCRLSLPSAGIKVVRHHLPACLNCILEYEVSIWAKAVGEGVELKGIESARLDPWLEGKGIEVLTYSCVGCRMVASQEPSGKDQVGWKGG